MEIRFCHYTSFSVFIPGGKYGGILYFIYDGVYMYFSLNKAIYLSISGEYNLSPGITQHRQTRDIEPMLA